MLLHLLFLFIVNVHAEPDAYVWTEGNTHNMKENFFKGANVQMMDSEEERREFEEDGYLPLKQREALFDQVGLRPYLKGMDDVDKDILVMSAKDFRPAQLAQIYPKLPPEILTKLVKARQVKK